MEMAKSVGKAAFTAVLLSLVGPVQQAEGQSSADARSIVRHAIDLMGGESSLRDIERVRLDMMTQWQRTGFREVPWTDRPSFEPHMDVRDYTILAWRNTRMFGARNVINVIRDSIALTNFGNGFQPLSIAYVDERDELFLYTPDRLILALADARTATRAADTLIGGESYAVVQANVTGNRDVRVYFHAGTGLPALLRFRAAHSNDFGLVPWGEMDVEVWYSNWTSVDGIGIPTQWDVLRVGRPYKRMTVRSAAFNPTFAADSFSTPPELRARFLAARGPMHDRQVDSVTMLNPRMAAVAGFGFPAGAFRTSDGWYLLGAGQHPLMLERTRSGLGRLGVERILGAVIGVARAGNGGVVALADEGVPLFVAPAAAPFVRVMLANAGRPIEAFTVLSEGRWLGSGSGRVRLEPVDLPDAPGSIMLHAPELGWLYAPDAATPLDVRVVTERANQLGWKWTALGTAAGIVVQGNLPPPH
jgi:hypothetical protein